MKNIAIRTLTGVVYILMVAVPILMKWSGLYVAVFSLFILMGYREYAMLSNLNRTRPLRIILDAIFGAYLYVAVLFYVISPVGINVFLPYIFYLLYLLSRGLYSDRDQIVQDASKTIFGQVYIALSLSVANLIAFEGNNVTDFSEMLSLKLLVIFIIIWVNDTFALLSGLMLGKHKLFAMVSPKKTWEGFFGGMIFSIITALVFGHYYPMRMPIYAWALLGFTVSLAGTFGDLFESALKRNKGVKDSGNLFPGHGGILDRLDSAFFAMPAAYIVYAIFNTM